MALSDEEPVIKGDDATIVEAAFLLLIDAMRRTDEPEGAAILPMPGGGALVAVDASPEGYLDLAQWALSQLRVAAQEASE